jgi:hypothetical protein
MIFQARIWNAVTSSRRASKKGETPLPSYARYRAKFYAR